MTSDYGDWGKMDRSWHQGLFDSSLVGLGRVSMTDGKVLHCNNRFREAFGWDDPVAFEAEFVLQERYVNPEVREKIYSALAQHGQINNWEVELIKRDGTVFTVLTSVRAFPEREYSEIIAFDISEHKNTSLALLDSEQRLREFVDFIPIIAFETDLEGMVIQINKYGRDLLGYDAEDISVGLHFRAILDDPDRAWENVQKKLAGIRGGDHNYCVLKKNGDWISSLIYVEPIVENESPFGFRGVALDITSLKRTEEDKARLEERLGQAQRVESIGRLAAGVAHDFNNLLSPIIGYSEVIGETLGASHPLAEDVREIYSAAVNAKELTRQLLAFGKEQNLQARSLRLNDVISDIRNIMERMLPEDVREHFELGSSLPPVEGDPSQLKQILINLSINAGEAMPSGGDLTFKTEQISLAEDLPSRQGSVPSGEYVRLSVRDTGEGMTRDVVERAFDPFFTTKQGSDGSGLGLFTVYGVAHKHGGHVLIDSSPGEGTTFQVYLPVLDEDDDRVSEIPDDPHAVMGGETLIVDDERMVTKLSCRLLSQRGYVTLAASSGSEAMEIVEKHEGPIHLLMTDVVMPDLDGRTLAQRLKELCPGIKTIFMSGHRGDILAGRGVSMDDVSFLAKPFTVETLVAKVREILGA